MASPSSKGAALLLSCLLVLSATSTAQAMTMAFTNSMNQEVGVECAFEGRAGDFGFASLPLGQRYTFLVGNGGNDFTGLRYSCTFATVGKPNTILEVFVGTGGLRNGPCECFGNLCQWSITSAGFTCNGGHFSHGWGP